MSRFKTYVNWIEGIQKRNYGKEMNLPKSSIIIRIIAVALFITVLAGTWDVWWHGAIGRDTLFEPPHLLLYSAVFVAILSGVIGWKNTKDKKWRNLAIVLLLVPISAPFDEIWHRMFGVEDLSSPLIIWSPPHVVIALAVILSAVIALQVIRRDTKEAQTFFGSLLFTVILSMGLFLLSPLVPEGPWHLLGFFGAGIISLFLIGTLLIAKDWIPSFTGVFLTIAFFLILASIGFAEKIAEGVTIVPHDHAPAFITIFSILLVAGVISFVKNKNVWFLAGVAGFLWSGVIYGFSWMFFEPQFVYSFFDGLVAIISGTIGASVIGFAYSRYKDAESGS